MRQSASALRQRREEKLREAKQAAINYNPDATPAPGALESALQVSTSRAAYNSIPPALSPRSPARPSPPLSPEYSLLAYASDTPLTPSFPAQNAPVLLPHPHAPRATGQGASTQPAILRSGDVSYEPPSPNPEQRTLYNTLSLAAAAGVQGPLSGRATIHGRTSHDLLGATGPVPISFAMGSYAPVTIPPSPIVETAMAQEVVLPPRPAPTRGMTAPTVTTVPQKVEELKLLPAFAQQDFVPSEEPSRRRSRSFSGVIAALETPMEGTLSDQPRAAFVFSEKLSHSAPSTPLVDSFSARHRVPVRSSTLASSPVISSSLRPRSSSPPRSNQMKPSLLPTFEYSDSTSSTPLHSPVHTVPSLSHSSPGDTSSNQSSPAIHRHPELDFAPQVRAHTPENLEPHRVLRGPSKESLSAYPPLKETASERPSPTITSVSNSPKKALSNISTTSLVSHPASQPAASRAHSLRSKISTSAMRNNARRAAAKALEEQEETVNVQDMEFTLIRPTTANPSSSRRSLNESVHSSQSRLSIPTGAEMESLRSFSPSGSPLPLSPTSPTMLSPFDQAFGSTSTHSPMDLVSSRPVNARSAQAYRQLESKWLSSMGSIPSAEAKKSRKIKKLVTDGIPASVRGVVWLYLTDSKGRRMPNLFPQLIKRKRIAAADQIHKDIERYFPDQPQFAKPDGSLMSLLQAYISMVPDTEYHYGLTVVAGHILRQTPEEDAFWTFVALMDSHSRGYFSPTARLLEIDSILFEKALLVFDKPLASRLFGELRVHCIDFCQHWFPTLFAIVLPPTHMNRVWDLVMFTEGPVFLFRLGLTILSYCRAFLLQCRSSTDALAYLIHPPPEIFPPDPDQIISTALGAKFKEDDIRKLRPKVEAHIKQPKQAPSSKLPIRR